jgi:aspartate/methionine/tyrosine aminotransferase
VFEPFYDAYLPGIAMAQAEARVVPLTPPEFRLDAAALEKAISKKTRLVLLNSPSNPACSVFTRAELEAIAALSVRHDLVVVTDEVYEHIVFEGATCRWRRFRGCASAPSRSRRPARPSA